MNPIGKQIKEKLSLKYSEYSDCLYTNKKGLSSLRKQTRKTSASFDIPILYFEPDETSDSRKFDYRINSDWFERQQKSPEVKYQGIR